MLKPTKKIKKLETKETTKKIEKVEAKVANK